jgi:hypothetical protein
MAWFADLSECNYFGQEYAKHLRAVGWLERDKPFPRASVDKGVLTKLSKLFREKPFEPGQFCGFHVCDLCPTADRQGKSLSNLFVPGEGTIYVAPEGILHYITEHGYAPPAEFNRAVVACPPMNSEAYFSALGDTTSDVDICQSARMLIREQDYNAKHEAMLRAGKLFVSGDWQGALTWHRILDAIERLQAKAPAEGKKVH